MSSRIRYKESEVNGKKSGVLRSIEYFHSPKWNCKYEIILDTNKMRYTIKNITNQKIAASGGEGINNLHVLKRKAKKRLEDLGVEFNKEIRDNSSRVKGVNCSYEKRKLE
jgi:hypothetical protein